MVAHAVIQALWRYDRKTGVQDHFQQNRDLGKSGLHMILTQSRLAWSIYDPGSKDKTKPDPQKSILRFIGLKWHRVA